MGETEFKKRDVVRLKSGGDKMTIHDFDWAGEKDEYSKDKVECIWHDSKGIRREYVYLHTLVHD